MVEPRGDDSENREKSKVKCEINVKARQNCNLL